MIGCVNFGTIYGNYNAGGLAGSSNGSDIINCYNAGNVYGGSSAGGIVGSIKQADVINCYNVGVVSTGSNGTAGALIGEHSSGYAENCYYLDNMSSAGPDETIAGTILDYNDISKRSSFVGFDFNSVWTMEGSENYSYPELLRTPIVVGEFTPSYTVVFKNWNGDILDSATYRYGEQVVTPENPIRQGEDGYFYSFVGSDKEIVPCNGNAVYTAVYDKTEIVITSIAVTKKPNKTNYLEGDAFEKTGMVVTAYYNNNTSATVTEYTVRGYTSTPGTKTITVTYSGKTTTFTVEVVTKALTNIAVTKMPTKTTFLEAKDELTVIGGQITLYYNNGTTQTIDMIPSMVSGFDNNTVGSQTLTVTYNGKTTRYNIEIMAKSLTSIELIDNGLKKEYLEGKDLLDITNGTVRLHYNNGTYSDIALTPAMVLDFNNTVVGNQILTVIYGGFTDTYSIEIIEKSLMAIELIKMPSKLEYLANNDSLDVENGRIKLIYNNDTFEEKDLTKSMISGFDNTIVGKQDLTITYHGKTTTYQIEVLIDYTPGDIDGVEGVTDRDAVYLLYYTFLPDMYPINQDCDFNGDGEVNDKDAVYLLYYTFLPDLYPIN